MQLNEQILEKTNKCGFVSLDSLYYELNTNHIVDNNYNYHCDHTEKYTKKQIDDILFQLLLNKQLIFDEKELIYSRNCNTKYIYNDLRKQRIHYANELIKYNNRISINCIEENEFKSDIFFNKTYLIELRLFATDSTTRDYPIINYTIINCDKYKKFNDIEIDYIHHHRKASIGTIELWKIICNDNPEYKNSRINITIMAKLLDDIIKFTKDKVEYAYTTENKLCNLYEEARIGNCGLKEIKEDFSLPLGRKPKYDIPFPEGLTSIQRMNFIYKYLRNHNDNINQIDYNLKRIQKRINYCEQSTHCYAKYWLGRYHLKIDELLRKRKELLKNE